MLSYTEIRELRDQASLYKSNYATNNLNLMK